MPPMTLMTPEDVARELKRQKRTIFAPTKRAGASLSRGIHRPIAARRNRDLTVEVGNVTHGKGRA